MASLGENGLRQGWLAGITSAVSRVWLKILSWVIPGSGVITAGYRQDKRRSWEVRVKWFAYLEGEVIV